MSIMSSTLSFVSSFFSPPAVEADVLRARLASVQAERDALALQLKETEAALCESLNDPIFGILTRAGVERRVAGLRGQYEVVFLDVDNMHAANENYGHEGVNERITNALNIVRSSDIPAGRWLRGDEIVFIVAEGTGAGLAQRVGLDFIKNGLSATFGVAPLSGNLKDSVQVAAELVLESKNRGIKGVVLVS